MTGEAQRRADAPSAGAPRDVPPVGLRLGISVHQPPTDRSFRCSTASRARGESLVATASTVSRFILIEEPGPWGPAVLNCRRLPAKSLEACRRWESSLGIRPLLIRRPGRSPDGPRRVFVVNSAFGWCESTLVESLDEVAALDLSGIDSPDGVGLYPHTDPLLLVCTHGRHDACCAERGRPLAAELAAQWPDEVWESSHLGGDRFSANLLALPHGHCFGRLEPEDGVEAVSRLLDGHLSLDFYRGRTTRPWVAQAAEAEVRRRFGLTRVDDVATRVLRRDSDSGLVEVTANGELFDVTVEIAAQEPERLTCSAASRSRAPRYSVDAPLP